MDSTPLSSRCAKPHCTNHSTDRYTASQLVWNARAVSRQLNRRAQRAKNPIMAQVTGRLPSLQGMCSTNHPVLGALHPSWCVAKIGRDAPQRNKQPAPLPQPVIARRRLLTLRAAPPHAPMGLHCDFNPVLMPSPLAEPNLLVNKPYIMLNPVQNRFNFELNGWSPGRALVCCSNHRLTPPTKTSYSLLDPFLAAPGAASPSACLFRRRRRSFPSLAENTHRFCYRAKVLKGYDDFMYQQTMTEG